MDLLEDLINNSDHPIAGCSCSCGGAFLEDEMEQQVLIGEKGDSFPVTIPIYRCDSCDAVIADHKAETVRHIAACRHLKILMPEEIRGIRERSGMTIEKFAHVHGIPLRTLEECEAGRQMQNDDMDKLLRKIEKPSP